MYGLERRVAVVTGGGRGIGRGIALALGAAGARVVVNDVAPGAAGDAVADIQATGGTGLADGTDISRFSGGNALIDTAVANYGRVDILATCAGNFWPDMTLEVTEKRPTASSRARRRNCSPATTPPCGRLAGSLSHRASTQTMSRRWWCTWPPQPPHRSPAVTCTRPAAISACTRSRPASAAVEVHTCANPTVAGRWRRSLRRCRPSLASAATVRSGLPSALRASRTRCTRVLAS